MILQLLILAQTIVPEEPLPRPAVNRVVIPGATRDTCTATAADGEIMVCGSADRGEQYRLRPLPEKYVDRRDARIDLPGAATVRGTSAQGRLGDAQIFITLKVPF